MILSLAGSLARPDEARLVMQHLLHLGVGAGGWGGDPDGPDDTTAEPGFPTALPTPGDGQGGHGRSPGQDTDETLALLLPLLILLTTLLFLLLIFLLFLIVLRKNRGIVLREEGGPTNLEQEDELDGEGGLVGIEQRWLDGVDDAVRTGYTRAKVWQSQYPPNSHPTDITLSQFLSIQEKGVSAWSFEPDYESNPALIVQSRTEITFLADGVGMADAEGGGCCVQSNLPLPKLNEVYYWECKMYEKPEGTTVAIGLATKPFPSFRLPGWNKYSVGYFSSDGFKSHSYPFTAQSYGPPLTEGDVLGIGYRPRTGTVFYTRNGKKLEDAYVGLGRHNLFPTVGATAACCVHVNLGQAGFVFIEANVKKWGLAPMLGTLAPPPAYGSERGSILLESAGASRAAAAGGPSEHTLVPPRMTDPHVEGGGARRAPAASSSSSRHKNRRRDPTSRSGSAASASASAGSVTATSAAGAAAALALAGSSANQPIRPSPLRHSRQMSSSARSSSSTLSGAGSSDRDGVENPPTPGVLDISLQSLHGFPREFEERDDRDDLEDDGAQRRRNRAGEGTEGSSGSASGSASDEGDEERASQTRPAGRGATAPAQGQAGPSSRAGGSNVSPPAYHPIDPHRYAAGVAEAMLEDAFAATTPSSRQYIPTVPTSFSGASTPSEGRYEAATAGGAGGSSSGWRGWLGMAGQSASAVSSGGNGAGLAAGSGGAIV